MGNGKRAAQSRPVATRNGITDDAKEEGGTAVSGWGTTGAARGSRGTRLGALCDPRLTRPTPMAKKNGLPGGCMGVQSAPGGGLRCGHFNGEANGFTLLAPD